MTFGFGRNRLRAAIERGLANRNLDGSLEELGELVLKSKGDAEAICWGLQQILKAPAQGAVRDMDRLIQLFQEVEDRECAAFGVLQEQGIPNLLRLFDTLCEAGVENRESTLLFILKIAAMYGTADGVLKIIEAARLPLKPDDFMWSVVLGSFTKEHPQKELLFGGLRDPLPPDFIGVSLLDAANHCRLEGESFTHPFDSEEGRTRLRHWLSHRDAKEYSYAHSATAALPFLSEPGAGKLLELALQHPDEGVRLEAAWAAAKFGRDDGLQSLARWCLDLNHAQKAQQYLSELGREDLVPEAAREPGFQAMAEFAQWLAHPNELGRPPDSLEIVDHRELAWPPDRELKPFWLIKFTAQDPNGIGEDDCECGLVGSTTFCFFSYKLTHRPPDDAYAVHCYWEMESAGLISETEVSDDAADYNGLLQQWRGQPLEHLQIRYVAEISPDLGYPQRLVVLAAAQVGGEDGWVVLDGERSRWYPKSEQPPEVFESVVLKIHVGRELLGFRDQPDRKRYLLPPPSPRPAGQVIAAYQKLLSDAAVKQGEDREKACVKYGPLGNHLQAYVDALKTVGREAEITLAIELLAPYWEHCDGFATIGRTAYQCGKSQLAEQFLVKARQECANWERCEEMGFLAEIWFNRGEHTRAKELLVEALCRISKESKTATGSDVRFFEEHFQQQRATLLRLYPAEGDGLMAANGLPASTLRSQ